MRNSIHSLLLAAGIGMSAPPVFAQPVEPATMAMTDGTAAELMQEVRPFLEAFINGDNTPQQQLSFFADRVHYYDQGVLGKNAIARDIQYTMRRWPWRKNRLVEIEYLKPLPEEDKVFVSYVVEYEVSNATKIVTGTARYGAMIGSLSEQPRIEGILEKVTRRKPISTLE